MQYYSKFQFQGILFKIQSIDGSLHTQPHHICSSHLKHVRHQYFLQIVVPFCFFMSKIRSSLTLYCIFVQNFPNIYISEQLSIWNVKYFECKVNFLFNSSLEEDCWASSFDMKVICTVLCKPMCYNCFCNDFSNVFLICHLCIIQSKFTICLGGIHILKIQSKQLLYRF